MSSIGFPMIPALLLSFSLLNPPALPAPSGEPDGSRTLGILPPFKAEPQAPTWLRATSHALAMVDTRHYLYEVYALPSNQWLVRYVLLPEEGEAFREIEQIFLFGPKPADRPKVMKNSDFVFEAQEVTWKERRLPLVDRRDLLRP